MTVVATRWTAGENKWKANLSSTTSSGATSLGVGTNGLNGTDICYCIELGSDRYLWVFGDSWWPTASGQVRTGGVLVGNAVALQQGATFNTSTLTFHCGPDPDTGTHSVTAPHPYFAEQHGYSSNGHRNAGIPRHVRYPLCGARLADDRVLVVGMDHVGASWFPQREPAGLVPQGGAYGTTPTRTWAVMLYGDIDVDDPDDWVHVQCQTDFPNMYSGIPALDASLVNTQRTNFHFGPGVANPGDGWVYVWCMGPWDQSGQWSVVRYPLEDVLDCRLLAGEWWAGGDRWVVDRANAMRRVRLTPNTVATDQGGAVMLRQDGKYAATIIPEAMLPITENNDARKQPAGATVQYAVADSPGAVFEFETVYTMPIQFSDFEFRYGAYELPESQTWSGKQPGDRAFIYSANNSSPALLAFTDARQYQPEMLTVTGLP